jgi:hypothetical protein
MRNVILWNSKNTTHNDGFINTNEYIWCGQLKRTTYDYLFDDNVPTIFILMERHNGAWTPVHAMRNPVRVRDRIVEGSEVQCAAPEWKLTVQNGNFRLNNWIRKINNTSTSLTSKENVSNTLEFNFCNKDRSSGISIIEPITEKLAKLVNGASVVFYSDRTNRYSYYGKENIVDSNWISGTIVQFYSDGRIGLKVGTSKFAVMRNRVFLKDHKPGYDKFWSEMIPRERSAVVELGWTSTMWDAGTYTPMLGKQRWFHNMDVCKQDAAVILGYTSETWDYEF